MSIEQFVTSTRKGLRFKNIGLSFKSEGTDVGLTATTIDSFDPNYISAAHYTILAETKDGDKETLNANLVSTNSDVYYTVFGRINTGTDLLSITSSIDHGLVVLQASTTESDVKVSLIKHYSENIQFD